MWKGLVLYYILHKAKLGAGVWTTGLATHSAKVPKEPRASDSGSFGSEFLASLVHDNVRFFADEIVKEL